MNARLFFSLTFSLIISAAHADVVTDWNSAALQAIRTGRTSPPQASRALAILHAAIYDAVNGIRRTHEPYLTDGFAPAGVSVVSRRCCGGIGRRRRRPQSAGEAVPRSTGQLRHRLRVVVGGSRRECAEAF